MRLVLVTGMHRAGTSLVARVLGLLGADLGPDELMMAPTEDNPRGYWELQEVADLDNDLIERLQGRWHRLPGFVETWEFAEDLGPLRDRARDLLARAFPDAGSGDVVAVKDPRLSVVLPFWRTVAEVDRTVLPLRRPEEVVGSLVKRDGMAPGKAAGLWTDHVAGALAHDPQALLTTFDDMLADPVAEASRLAAAVGLPEPTGEAAAAIEAFRDPGLQRNAGYDAGSGRELVSASALYDSLTGQDRDRAVALASQLWHDRNERRVWQDRHRDTDLELQRRLHDLERVTRQRDDLAPYPERARIAESELRKRNNDLKHARRQAARWQDEYERLTDRKSVQMALKSAAALKPVIRKARQWRGVDPSAGREPGLRTAAKAQAKAAPHVPATKEEAAALQSTLVQSAPTPTLPDDPPHVTVAILTRDGLHHLQRCLPALARTDYPNLDLVVVDNASSDGSAAWLDQFAGEAPFPITVVRNADNATFSAGNNQAIRATADGRTGDDLVLLLNNDIEPVEPHWLTALVTALRDRGAAAVGTRLVYPRREALDNAGDLTFPDLSLQHRGIAFEAPFDGVPRGRNLGAGEDPLSPLATRTGRVAAATAACLLVRRDALDEVGGLTEDYVYGTEDVELCLKLRAAGGDIAYEGKVALWHHEYGTQNAEGRDAKRRNRRHNREVFVDTWGPRLFRELLLDKSEGDATRRVFSEDPLHVAITVTKDDESAGYGDWFTAHEFGNALEQLGWTVSYVEQYGDRWYDLDPSIDVVVAMLDAFDLARIPRHVVACAWVRNWPQRWTSRDWFDDYDLVFASSAGIADEIRRSSVHQPVDLPLAANAERFRPGSSTADVDALFVGSRWDRPRAIEAALPALASKLRISLRGHGWQGSPPLRDLDDGPIEYADLPEAYASVPIVLDDTADHAKPFHAVNSRVFDALAAGALVVTDNPEGCAELFDTPVPSWRTADELVAVTTGLLEDQQERERLVEDLRAEVLARHTYAHRAQAFAATLRSWARARRMTVLIGVPRREEAHAWGDHHYARAMQRSLHRLGVPTRVAMLPDWDAAWISQSDAVVHLFGLSEYRTRPGQVNVLWNISHPEKVTVEQVEQYDLACIASSSFAQDLAARTSTPVHTLLQAADTDRMRPGRNGPEHDLLFVANSRRVRRHIVDDVARAGLTSHLAVYGREWTSDLVDPACVKGEHVDNRDLAGWYGSAKVVLNDHWDDMRSHGFLSNRLFDALASGAFVLSDEVEGIDDVFDGIVETYTDPDDLRAKVARWLGDEDGRRGRAQRGRALVVERHSFDTRMAQLLDLVQPHLDQRPTRVLPASQRERRTRMLGGGVQEQARQVREALVDKLAAVRQDDPGAAPTAASSDPAPLHVAVTVTKDDESAGYGDWYTAHQFGDALERLGMRVSYAERYRDRWYDLDPSVDVLVAMVDAIDLARVPSHVVTCAWVRNWPQRWLSHPWFDHYDVVFASSSKLREAIEASSRHQCLPLALAADPDLFHPRAHGGTHDRRDRADILFVGSRHDKPRLVEHAFGGLARSMRLELRGHGWDKEPTTANLTDGPIPYRDLPAAYASVPLVVDDTVGEATKAFDAVNSRVFEAIAAGALVLTDNPEGCAELFDTPVPSWSDPDDLVEVAKRWLLDDAARTDRVHALRDELVAHHTYDHRARQFVEAVAAWAGSSASQGPAPVGATVGGTAAAAATVGP